MELWIRSQNREELKKCEQLYYYFRNGHHYITRYYDEDIIGSYKTKERCLEILDEIENILKPKIKYTKGKINGSFNGVVIRNEDTMEIKEFSTVVYQMPKE